MVPADRNDLCEVPSNCTLTLEPIPLQKSLFRRRCLPAEYGVAVGEAAEAGDWVAVEMGEFELCLQTERLIERDGAVLIGEVF